jgi:autotransporter-associated beta strand protein
MLSGGGGINTLAGGLGDDTYAFSTTGASDTVNEAAGQGTDMLDFGYVSGFGIDATISGTIAVTYGTSTTSVPTAAGIDRVRGTYQTDRFRVPDGVAFAGILDGLGQPGYAFTDMDILDLSAWTAPVAVSYLGALDVSFVGSSTGTGGVVNLRHVIGGTKNDILRAGAMPVWFEGKAGNDTLAGSVQSDLLDGGNDDDSLSASYGDDTLRGGWGSDTLAGGPGNDTYSFFDLFGTDTILETPDDGHDTMDFSAVLSALTVSLGSVTVTAPGASATHAGSAIEAVIGGAGDDTFVMTSPSVMFPGTLDGGGGANTLRYDAATPTLVAQVKSGQTPNVGLALKLGTVIAVPAYTPIDLTVPALSTVTDGIIRTGNQRIVKQGSGKLILSLANSHSEGTSVEAGELVVKNVAALGTGGLEIAAGAKASLDVGTVGIKIGFIKFDGLLDIDRATLTVASGLTQASLVAGLAAGRGDGSWNGGHGIASSAAAVQMAAGVPRAIGWKDNGDGSFTIGYTVPGDTDLDKRVDLLDAANFIASGKFDTGLVSTWAEGNFNYDDVVDILDVSDFFNGSIFDSGPLAAANASTPTADTTTPSMNDLVFAALAQNEQSRTTTRKKAFAVL